MKILYILNSLTMTNGISSLVMSYYNRFNHSEIKCDFIIHYNPSRTDYYDQIEKNGDSIFIMDNINIKNVFKNKKKIKDFFLEHHDYDVIHCHLPHISYLYLRYAQMYSIKKRIIHVHNPILSDKKLACIRNAILLKKAIHYSTDLFACSEDTGNKIYKNKIFYVQKNAFDYSKYYFNLQSRKKVRSSFQVSNQIVVGCVGRFSKQKNFIFSLRCLLSYVALYDDNIRLVFVGNGKEKKKYDAFISKYHLGDKVFFVNPTNRISEFYSSFDILLMPSIFEGLGIVSLEAQVNGLHVLHSENIPIETNIGGSISIPLNDIKLWCYNIAHSTRNDFTVSSNYEIEKNVKSLIDKYKGL